MRDTDLTWRRADQVFLWLQRLHVMRHSLFMSTLFFGLKVGKFVLHEDTLLYHFSFLLSVYILLSPPPSSSSSSGEAGLLDNIIKTSLWSNSWVALDSHQTEDCCFSKPQSLHTQTVSAALAPPPPSCYPSQTPTALRLSSSMTI